MFHGAPRLGTCLGSVVTNRNLYRISSAALFVAGIAAEAARLVKPWAGFSPDASRVVSVFLIALWVSAAIAVGAYGRWRAVANVAWAIATAGALGMFVHGAVTRVGGAWIGLCYLPAAIVLGVVLKRFFVGDAFLINVSREPRHPGGPQSAPRTV